MSTGTDRIEIRNLLNPTPDCADSLKFAQSSPETYRPNWKIPTREEQQEQPQGSWENARFIRGVSRNIEVMLSLFLQTADHSMRDQQIMAWILIFSQTLNVLIHNWCQ